MLAVEIGLVLLLMVALVLPTAVVRDASLLALDGGRWTLLSGLGLELGGLDNSPWRVRG